jgi:hypothetical protein
MKTVIGAYQQVKRLAERAGAKKTKLLMTQKNGDSAAKALEHAADTLDAISSSMIRSKAAPSHGKLSMIAKSLTSISRALDARPDVKAAKTRHMSSRSLHRALAVHDHGAELLNSHLSALLANATNYTKPAYWKSFDLNEDGSIKL